ncbi:MAG: secretin N-terminal domain-containing protein [Verrucomicrobiota bacterium]
MSFHHSIAILLLGLASAFGQEPAAENPAIQPPGVPIPGEAPTPAAGAPSARPTATATPASNLGQTLITEPIEELKLSGDALAGLYRKYTGRRVIISTAASTAEFRFVQDASPKDPLTFAQAAELLKKAATIENFVFVPDEQDPTLDILTLSTGGIRPTGRGVAVYNENVPLPDGDAVISYVMTLSYIKPAEAVNTFTQIIGQFGAYGSIAPVPNASAVVITENTSLIRKLIDLKKEIDKPSSQVSTRFIKVQFADVTEIATTLTTLLTAQQSAQKTAGVQRDGQPAAPVPAGQPAGAGIPNQPAAAGGGGSGEETPVQIIPDPRTNRIFAMGRPVDLLFVEGLIREFDVETSEKNFLRRKLRFLTVADFLPVAGDALNRAFSGTGEGGSTSGGGGGSQASTRPQAGTSNSPGRSGSTGANFGGSSRSDSNRNGSSSMGGSAGSSMGGGSGGGSMGGGGGGGGGPSAPNVSSAPASVLVGRTLLVADNITNSIVVQGPPSGLEIIERLLDQIDVKPDQVMISTVIGQLSLTNEHTSGMSYLGLGGDTSIFGGSGGSPILPILGATAGSPFIPATNSSPAIPATPAIPGGPNTNALGGGLHVYGKIGGNLNYYLQALQTKSDFTVLSRPSIFTSNNQMGTISSGEKIAIPTGSTSYGSSSNSSTQIQYQDVVLKLQVVPLVNSDNEITMQISLLNDEQNGTQVIQGGAGNGGNLTVPKISTREILTTATVPNNETIVLGGLIVGRGGNDKSGIPILCDIPFLGKLFSSTSDTKNRSELMVFIQPSIVRDAQQLNTVQENMDARYKVSEKVRGMADGPDGLPTKEALLPLEEKGRSAAEAPKSSSKTKSKTKSSIQPANRK